VVQAQFNYTMVRFPEQIMLETAIMPQSRKDPEKTAKYHSPRQGIANNRSLTIHPFDFVPSESLWLCGTYFSG